VLLFSFLRTSPLGFGRDSTAYTKADMGDIYSSSPAVSSFFDSAFFHAVTMGGVATGPQHFELLVQNRGIHLFRFRTVAAAVECRYAGELIQVVQPIDSDPTTNPS
jgi:hypothetical protein